MLSVGAVFPTYLWSNGAITQSDSVNTGGTYSVTVTSTNGCSGISSTMITNACAIPAMPAIPTTNIGATYAMGNWIQPSCHQSYNVRISIHNANSWTTNTIPPNSHYTFSGLAHNTAYDWQIQTNCNASLTNVSGYSAVQTFTTVARLGDGITNPDQQIASFQVYPNPANDQLTVVFSSNAEELYSIRMIDITGRVVMNKSLVSVGGDNQYELNLAAIPRGLYLVLLQNGVGVMQRNVVVE